MDTNHDMHTNTNGDADTGADFDKDTVAKTDTGKDTEVNRATNRDVASITISSESCNIMGSPDRYRYLNRC